MKRNKRAGIGAAFLICILLTGGCSSKNKVVNYEENREDIVSIKFFGNKYEPENVTVIEEIISDFMKDNPDIRVSYESLKGTEYFEALEKRMEAGKGSDVFMVNHDSVLKLEQENKLADLSKLHTIPGYTEQMLGQMKTDGKIYWVPTTVSVFGLYCNTDLLKKHGQKIPNNLKEWESVCGYFKEQGITPVIANNDISLKTLAIGRGFYEVYRENRQSEVFDRLNRGEEKLSTYLTDGFSTASELVENGYIDGKTALNTEKTSDDLKEFVKGKSPFMLTGAWAAGRVKNMEPDFKFQVVPYPGLEDDSFVVVNADTRLSVNADSEHPDAAMKFTEYFTRPENIQKFADQQSSLSPLKGGSPSSAEEIQPLISCYESGKVVIGSDGLLNLPIWDLSAQVSKMLLAGEDVKETMEWLDKKTAEERGAQE